VSSTASTRLVAIRRHASDTVVASGIVSALDSRSFFTVLSPLYSTQKKSNLLGVPSERRRRAGRRGSEALWLPGMVGGGRLGGDLPAPVSVGGGRGVVGLAGGGRRRAAARAAARRRRGPG
jgi:hypothetical protein